MDHTASENSKCGMHTQPASTAMTLVLELKQQAAIDLGPQQCARGNAVGWHGGLALGHHACD